MESFEEISDSIVVGRRWEDDMRVILFVKSALGVELTEELKAKIRKTIRNNATRRHVPALILPVTDIPITPNGKKVELAVRNVIEARPVTNRDALLNPEALNQFADFAELREQV